MKRVYICSPLKGNIQRNIAEACRHCRSAILSGVIPIAPHLYFTQFLDDTVAAERGIGVAAGLEMLTLCEEVWVYGAESEGMKAEIAVAKMMGIPVRYKGWSEA